ncbi:MAG: hypothetical protein N2746_01025 [Deltaproteobacteria bacterium]|nr:hypothetical protein [Deltaproteobacteria bacterium]
MKCSNNKKPGHNERLPSFFKGILWFLDFDKIELDRDKEAILFQVLEKGRMEHLFYLQKIYSKDEILSFAKINRNRFSRKSIYNFIRFLYSNEI